MLVVHFENARRLALSSGVSLGELGTLIKSSVGIGEPRWLGGLSATRMKSSLWAGLPWSRLPASALNDVDRVVDCYRESAANLQERFQEAAAFVRNTYCVNVVFRGGGGFDNESLPKQLQSNIVAELKSLDQLRSRIDNALTAELITQSSEVIVAELHASLENNVNAIVDGLHRVLDRLVSANVLGQLMWLPGKPAGSIFIERRSCRPTIATRQSLSDGMCSTMVRS